MVEGNVMMSDKSTVEIRMTVAELIAELSKFQSTLTIDPFNDYEITGEQGIEVSDKNGVIGTILTIRTAPNGS